MNTCDELWMTDLRRGSAEWAVIYPHESQVSVFRNQGVLDYLSRLPTKPYFKVKQHNTGVLQVISSLLSIYQKALSDKRRYGDAITVICSVK